MAKPGRIAPRRCTPSPCSIVRSACHRREPERSTIGAGVAPTRRKALFRLPGRRQLRRARRLSSRPITRQRAWTVPPIRAKSIMASPAMASRRCSLTIASTAPTPVIHITISAGLPEPGCCRTITGRSASISWAMWSISALPNGLSWRGMSRSLSSPRKNGSSSRSSCIGECGTTCPKDLMNTRNGYLPRAVVGLPVRSRTLPSAPNTHR